MNALIRHTVRKGSIVIYPRWQTAIATPCPGPFDIEPCIDLGGERHPRRACIPAASAPRSGCSHSCDRTSYFGFSFGGIITANLTNRYRKLHLPKPSAIWLEDPHDGGLDGFDEPAVDDSLRGIPASRRSSATRAREGVISEPDRADGSCNAIFPKLGHIPRRNKDLVLTAPDAHGTPALSSPHGVCTARKGLADAYDWDFCWKAWDALRDCAYFGPRCRYALGDTPQHRSNGSWSDGVPVAPLKIQDAAPIRP